MDDQQVADWVSTVCADARATRGRIFSASVPLSDPGAAWASEPLLSRVIEEVEAQGWRLESVSPYGSPDTAYMQGAFRALLVFRSGRM
ncbi:hypothetical protein [Streptomyces sp. NPDC059639]|uniref:hypothetical protein n=1 Tax=Streptomyces sp. NPDC059639 TaxID=3346891 RepID=UPI0036AEBAE3